VRIRLTSFFDDKTGRRKSALFNTISAIFARTSGAAARPGPAGRRPGSRSSGCDVIQGVGEVPAQLSHAARTDAKRERKQRKRKAARANKRARADGDEAPPPPATTPTPTSTSSAHAGACAAAGSSTAADVAAWRARAETAAGEAAAWYVNKYMSKDDLYSRAVQDLSGTWKMQERHDMVEFLTSMGLNALQRAAVLRAGQVQVLRRVGDIGQGERAPRRSHIGVRTCGYDMWLVHVGVRSRLPSFSYCTPRCLPRRTAHSNCAR
jgi:hypothetical protein